MVECCMYLGRSSIALDGVLSPNENILLIGSQFEGVKARLLSVQRNIENEVKSLFGGSYERYLFERTYLV